MRTSCGVPPGARFMRRISSWRRGSATSCRCAADSESGACEEVGGRALHGLEVGPEAGREQVEEAVLVDARQAAVGGEQARSERDARSLSLAGEKDDRHRFEIGGRASPLAAPPARQSLEQSLCFRAHATFSFLDGEAPVDMTPPTKEIEAPLAEL